MNREGAGGFQKGQGGNPGGRPVVAREVTELARQNAARAVARLVELIDADDPRVAIAASNAILDRACGRPRQTQELDVAGDGNLVVEIRR
jgi:hypothetical protein